ncbi:hypothetical protein H6G33_10740 [Calothrix sp. FACHB-1219]|uniref:hypothetical protein n=1 Tax=unclassified Calothrix TaxID=2619626 RepID=UPI0016884961|nr:MULTISPECIES: hypothetical protein [unclassified Calothrix]MBD2201825.1 hypothetical protein [Calothrix sp. FACHB-168]MBD2217511.1 hypothetical protein [Calothrix sp. FACHB-1219]
MTNAERLLFLLALAEEATVTTRVITTGSNIKVRFLFKYYSTALETSELQLTSSEKDYETVEILLRRIATRENKRNELEMNALNKIKCVVPLEEAIHLDIFSQHDLERMYGEEEVNKALNNSYKEVLER